MRSQRSRCALAGALFLAGVSFTGLPATTQAQGAFNNDVAATIHQVVNLIAEGVNEDQPRHDIRQLNNALQHLLDVLEAHCKDNSGHPGHMGKGLALGKHHQDRMPDHNRKHDGRILNCGANIGAEDNGGHPGHMGNGLALGKHHQDRMPDHNRKHDGRILNCGANIGADVGKQAARNNGKDNAACAKPQARNGINNLPGNNLPGNGRNGANNSGRTPNAANASAGRPGNIPLKFNGNNDNGALNFNCGSAKPGNKSAQNGGSAKGASNPLAGNLQARNGGTNAAVQTKGSNPFGNCKHGDGPSANNVRAKTVTKNGAATTGNVKTPNAGGQNVNPQLRGQGNGSTPQTGKAAKPENKSAQNGGNAKGASNPPVGSLQARNGGTNAVMQTKGSNPFGNCKHGAGPSANNGGAKTVSKSGAATTGNVKTPNAGGQNVNPQLRGPGNRSTPQTGKIAAAVSPIKQMLNTGNANRPTTMASTAKKPNGAAPFAARAGSATKTPMARPNTTGAPTRVAANSNPRAGASVGQRAMNPSAGIKRR